MNQIKRNILLNPGPATTTDSVKRAQLVPDICPREEEFGNLMNSIRNDLVKIAGGNKNYTCVLLGGSGTAAMDSVISSVVSNNKKILILNNGAYGERMVQIAKTYDIDYIEQKFEWGTKINIDMVKKNLERNNKISYITVIHHETTTGMLNPIKIIGDIAKKNNCVFIVDTISSFAGIPFSIKECNIDFMMSTSNKCIQGMPGVAFVICKKSSLEKTKNYKKKSYYLNLYDQFSYLEKNKQTRFTPPVQSIYALHQAIKEFFEEGSQNRYNRYLKNWDTLICGMEKLGFKKLLSDEEESHILTTFYEPKHPNYDFTKMHDLLYSRGFTIYPGKIGKKNTFRIANMGAINHLDIDDFLKNLKHVMDEMNLKLL